jgi:hypothetical protein
VTLKTSLIITGDASVAKREVEGLTAAIGGAAAGSRAAVAPAQQLDAAQKQVAASARDEAAALGVADAAIAEAAKSARVLSTVNAAVVTSNGAAGRSTRELTKAVNDNEQAARRHQFGLRNAGQQVGDFGLQVASGQSALIAGTQQIGQFGYALSEMGGKAGAVGAFLTGPWGIALTVGGALLAPFIAKLFETAEAEKAVELGASGMADAQGALGQMFDLTTGKLKKQNTELAAANELMRLNIRLTAINLRADAAKEAASSQKTLGSAGSISVGDRLKGAFTDTRLFGTVRGAIDGTDRGRQNATNLQNVVRDLQAGKTTNEQVLQASEKIDFTGLKVTKAEFQAAIRDGVSAVAKRQIASLADSSLDAGVLDPALRNTGKTKKPPKPKSTEARDEFGRDAGDKLAGIVSQFDGTPDVIEKTNAKIRDLDDLIDDLGRKKPPGFQDLIAQAEAAKVIVRDGLIAEVAKAFEQPKTLAEKAGAAIGQLDAVIADLSKNKPPSFEKLIADAETAKGVVRDGLLKPYADYLQQQQDGLEVQRLTIAGRLDEAEALKTIQGLQRTMGPLTAAQKDGVLATVQALRAQNAELDAIRQNTAKYVDALGGIKGVVQDATQDFARGDLGQLLKNPGKLLDVFQTFQGRKLFDKLFGDTFRDLESQINGTSAVKDASDRMAKAVDAVATQTNKTTGALDQLAAAATSTAGALGNKADAGGAIDPSAVGQPANAAGAIGSVASSLGVDDPNQEIIVTGKRPAAQTGIADPFSSALAKVSTDIAGIFTNPSSAKEIGRNIGSAAGKGLEGAATGAFVNGILSPIGKVLGVKTSQTGAQIGGAVGSFVPIPGGQIIGSIIGSVVGGLFKSNNKYGSSSLQISDGVASAGTAIGKGSAEKNTANALGGSLADGLNSVADALGTTLGSAAVSIGYRPNHKAAAYRVDTSGQGKVTGGTIQAFETEAEAVAAAIHDAILDGGIIGLSQAMQKALSSSSDIDKAVKEALGVKALETAIGGVAGALKAQFDAEDAAAKERVRLAKSYGIDVVAVEKLNAENRIKLTDQLLKAQTGTLQSLVDEITQGSLFEGTAMDRIAALNTSIGRAKTDLANGVDGAGDTLSSLLQQRLAASKEAYGTTSGYAADRTATLDEARAAIAKANADIVKAGGTTDPALATTNAALATSNTTLDEIAEQNARMLAAQIETNRLLAIANNSAPMPAFDLKQLGAY